MSAESSKPDSNELLDALLQLDEDECLDELVGFTEQEHRELTTHWQFWARNSQRAPDGDWRTWVIMAGRGFGKTRAGSEWVRSVVEADPNARIALIGASFGEARAVMVEGESGLLAISPARRRPTFEPSLRRIVWPNGAQATLYSALEPEALRGPQHSHAWCDEIAKWDNANGKAIACWDNLLMGLRLGDDPRVLATTTPRAVPLLQRLLAEEGVEVTHGRTEDNTDNLPPRFISAIRGTYGETSVRPRRKPTSTRPMPSPMQSCIAQ